MRLILFCGILGLLGALATFFAIWYLRKLDPAAAGPATPDSINLATLLRDADSRIRQSGRAKSLAAMPLVYVIGDENSAKTQTILQSGIDPELIAGNVYQDGAVVPTQLANIWLAGNFILVEAGGALLRQPALWLKLIKATLPARLGSVFSKGSRLPARSVVLCVSIERLLAPNTSEQIRALAQTLNERLRQLSQTLGIALPAYVLFTKLDNIAPFGEYVGRLSEEEVKAPIGLLLAALDSGSGIYTEQATALISTRFDQLLFALSEFRLEVLSRGGELQELARAYEFPRDLRKVRSGIVSFLAEVARPSQIGVNPFLRGFFFTGMRAHMVEDVVDVGPARTQPTVTAETGATKIFSLAAMQAAQTPTPQRRGGMRKVPQWVFLPQVFSRILFADKSALEASQLSTRTSYLKRFLLATGAVLLLCVFSLFTISFFKNRSLEERVSQAASATVVPVSPGTYASVTDLQKLEALRSVLDELDHNRKEGAPFLFKMGLYRGNSLFPIACRAYSNKFRSLLLSPTQTNIVAKLHALPLTSKPEDDYGAIYRPLKAYIMTTSNPDPDNAQDTQEFLPSALLTEWNGNSVPPSDVSTLAQAQFAFYAQLLPDNSACFVTAGGAPNDIAVEQARKYLNDFQGFQHVYQAMLAAANRKAAGFTFNGTFSGSSKYIIDTSPVEGAFTKDGFTFMQNAIIHPEPYYSGEEWVLKSNAPAMDKVALTAQLKQFYTAEYIKVWRDYLNKAQFVGYKNFAEAGDKLPSLDSNTSAVLQLFSLVSIHTASAYPEIAAAFQPPQAIVPPNSTDNRLIGTANQSYIQALQGLEGAVKNVAQNPLSANDPAAAQQVTQAAINAEQASENLAHSFNPDPTRGIDKTSLAILEAPIESAKALASKAPATAAGGGAKTFCAQIAPVMAKFPFSPLSTTEATPDEVAQIFAPGSGAFSQFYNNTLKQLVVPQGSQFVPAPGSTVPINPAFLAFLNHAQKVSTALFSSGTQPSLDFTLTEVRSPSASDAVLTIDGQQITTAGQKVQFHWVSRSDGKTSVTSQGNASTPPGGPWSVFHLGFEATRIPPDLMRYSLQMNSQTNGLALFEASGPGAALLDKDFMKGLQCVANVAR
jgi:type VI secretion system protein ImpL